MHRIPFLSKAAHVGKLYILMFLCLITFSGSLIVTEGKTTISDLEEKMEENEAAIKEAQEDIASKEAAISVRHGEILTAEMEINQLNEIIFGLENDMLLKEEEITLTQEELEASKEEQKVYYELTKERIQVMYEYGSSDYLEVLLAAKSTSDFFNRLEYLNKMVEYDQNMLYTLQEIEAAIQEHENQLLIEKVELEDLKEENDQRLNEVEILRQNKEQEIVAIEEDKELLLEQIKMMEEEQIEIDKMIQELILLYSDKELVYGGGNVSWPVPGYSRISSSFGPRVHPVYGYNSYHTGIDIPAAYGTSIEAAASGQVIFSGWGNAYGNYVLIDHGTDEQGRHIITQYAHCSQVLVVEGDIVVRGDTIAKVGSTGWSTGNHLHFGIQIGGEWIDPVGRTDR